MKHIFFIFCIVSLTAGLGFYVHQNHTAASNVMRSDHPQGVDQAEEERAKERNSTETRQAEVSEVSVGTPITTEKKPCGCCTDGLEIIRQRRKELEMWAREMVKVHGYEEGMKRVTAKSSTLANRVQRLLEKEKVAATPGTTASRQ